MDGMDGASALYKRVSGNYGGIKYHRYQHSVTNQN